MNMCITVFLLNDKNLATYQKQLNIIIIVRAKLLMDRQYLDKSEN